jgi:hypothetical protein
MKSIALSFAVMSIAFSSAACTFGSDLDAAASPATGAPAMPADQGAAVVDARDPMAPAPKPRPGMAMVRAIHGSANAPAVDVYIKGNPTAVVSNLSYGQTSGWLEVPKGSYTFELRAAPSKASDPVAYVTNALTIDDGAMISAIAAGLLGSTDTDASFRILPLVERFDMVPGGQALIRAVHAGADAPSVDLDVGNDDPTKPELSGLARFDATAAEGVALPAGAELGVGIAKNGARVTSFTTPKLPTGGQLLVIATGLLAKPARAADGFALLAVGPNGSVGFIKQDPTLYALHASPDAPAVDGFVGTAEIFSNLQFGQISAPIRVAPGEYSVDLFGSTAGSARPEAKPAANGKTPRLSAGESYLVTASGPISGFKLITTQEGFQYDDSKAVLRALHASADAPAVDIGLVDDSHQLSPVLFKELTYTNASDPKGLAADPGHLFVGIAPKNVSTPIATFTVPARSAQRAFVVAAGQLNPAAGQKGFRFLVVDTAPAKWTVTSVFPH